MIFTVLNKYSRQHLGIVNERTPGAALREAENLFGNRWFKGSFLSPEAISVEPGDTQTGLEGR